ncbi:MAG: cell division protein FtsW [Parcubacteria group bacterium Gr01-1014_18]|nr:MAG: cell division protein FtsW [Parcubacteria group bacterium Greene0416_36]TSC81541.1 MAG: cell division protein FtsW [Parcubacteria group bacterium Gr01-1014_18]TSC99648.1 MAG: cell division protein FtsW [Parcubacteria group bacterium Greene1014_20]TSD07099.1 MAG: cell division protein FtsW [Parcubacteria group bacterium Greene0714_2]
MKSPDYGLVGGYLFLLVFGVIMLSSVSNAVAYQKFGDSYYYLKNQLLQGVIPGLIVMTLFSMLDYKMWKKWAFPFFVGSIILLLSVFLPGLGAELLGASRWIHIGGFSFQPSEAVKLGFLIYIAAFFAQRGSREIQDFHAGLVPFVSSLGLVMFLIILQPDVGTMSIIVFFSMMVYFIAGAPWRHLALLGAGGVFLFWLLVKIAPYRAARILAFMNPEADPQGISYHINQALVAIGSGGLWGKGLGNSIQKQMYLPEVVGDSIFAVIAEEMGFVVMVCFIFLLLWLFFRGLRAAYCAPDDFGKYLAAGITFWIIFQSFINIASMLSLIPLTGVPLPLVSYGSSSLVVTMAAIGILINISRQGGDSRGKRSFR